MTSSTVMQDRHAARFAASVATLQADQAPAPRLRARLHADGRVSFPDVVRYQPKAWDATLGTYVPAGPLLPLPPDAHSHPDDHAQDEAARVGKGGLPVSVPYTVVVLDLATHDTLKARGLLDIGHRIAPSVTPLAVDRRPAPGA